MLRFSQQQKKPMLRPRRPHPLSSEKKRRRGKSESREGWKEVKGDCAEALPGFMEPEASKEAEKQPMEAEAGDPADPRDLVSSDDEIDYSVEPEFYDPAVDDVDERWAHKQRKGRTSDAVLSCPACFTTLCLDSQRHEKYVNQYRAMFVCNCKVKTDQILREGKGKRKNRKVKAVDSTTPEVENKGPVYHPVCCEICSTEVGVFDEDEVYHFFNVIPSNS
ncbi:hypothetical protein ACQJBY_058812 [Aegilops geniculata]